MGADYIPIFIPSYHRPKNLKTIYWSLKLGYPAEKLYVFIDDATDDAELYRAEAERLGFNLVQFNMDEARARYDYVHRPSNSRRSAGQARNMFADYAREREIEIYIAIDDDTSNYQLRPANVYKRTASLKELNIVFNSIKKLMLKWHIGLFGLSQTGDTYSYDVNNRSFRSKVMNTMFVCPRYLDRAERGVQDDDTSQFVGIYNEGLFTGSLFTGLVLVQTQSAKQKGGLTDLYNECRLLNKALVTPIQFPTAIHAEKQTMNGGRLHHRITSRYLMPCIIKGKGARTNIPWDTYPEDYPFTNEPKNRLKHNG